jgi:hypothetical protein
MTHIFYNKNYIFLHEDIDYSQICNFVLTMMTNFEFFDH